MSLDSREVWIDDACDVCGAVEIFGVLLRGPVNATVLCFHCVLAIATTCAECAGVRPDRTSAALRAPSPRD